MYYKTIQIIELFPSFHNTTGEETIQLPKEQQSRATMLSSICSSLAALS